MPYTCPHAGVKVKNSSLTDDTVERFFLPIHGFSNLSSLAEPNRICYNVRPLPALQKERGGKSITHHPRSLSVWTLGATGAAQDIVYHPWAVSDICAERKSVQIYPLHPSPLAAARFKHRLSRNEAAQRLGIPTGQLKVIEMQTKRIPRPVMDSIIRMLAPESGMKQTTIFDYLEEIAAKEGGVTRV
jgi:hypothetical protein